MSDLISRSAMWNALRKKYPLGFDNDDIADAIINAPAVDAEPVRRGMWNQRPYHKINSKGRAIKYCDFYYCSECGTERPIVPPYKYCPNCGCKMDMEVQHE